MPACKGEDGGLDSREPQSELDECILGFGLWVSCLMIEVRVFAYLFWSFESEERRIESSSENQTSL